MTGVTDKDGVIILPPTSEGITDRDGKTDISETIPGKDTDGDGKSDTEETKTEYNITVEDTKGKIENAFIEIKDGKITVTLPDGKTLTTDNQTTVTVLDKENKGIANISVTVTDKNKVTATKSTDTNGKITIPVKPTCGGGSSSGGGGGRGGSSGGGYYTTVNFKIYNYRSVTYIMESLRLCQGTAVCPEQILCNYIISIQSDILNQS